MKPDLLLLGIGQLLTLAGDGPKIGREMMDLGIIENGAVAVLGDKITWVGPETSVDVELLAAEEVVDCSGKVVMPGFVDPHTHLGFPTWRVGEWRMKQQGISYKDILAKGGGILSTVRATRRAGEETLYEVGFKQLDDMLVCGTTTVEAKSGYGLSTEQELKQLRVFGRLNRAHPLELVPTFMGAHAVPAEFAGRTDEYVELVARDMIPRVAEEGLAEFCDVFCEQGIFSVEQARKILTAAKDWGLKLKIHADEMAPVGGTRLAAELRVTSADHLLYARDEDLDILAAGNIPAVLLPGVPFFLKMGTTFDARRYIDRGIPVALATDFNPGSSPCFSMPMMITLACFTMGMQPEEAIVAATVNAAYALDRADRVGSITPGRQADMIILNAEEFGELPYRFGTNLVSSVIKRGQVVVRDGRKVRGEQI